LEVIDVMIGLTFPWRNDVINCPVLIH
jgi:hypothetical protein